MDCSKIKVVKKDGTKEDFNVKKVLAAISKSAERAMITFSRAEKNFICEFVEEKAEEMDQELIPIAQMHNIVEGALDKVNPLVAKSYRDYRNYKQDFVRMLDDVYKKSQSIMYIGDKENSNTDSALVSTKRSLIFNELNKSLYQKFFMTVEELQACREGYIYIHDMSARRDTMNCCLFDVKAVLTGGFEMGNLWYNEPKTLDVAFDGGDELGHVVELAHGAQPVQKLHLDGTAVEVAVEVQQVHFAGGRGAVGERGGHAHVHSGFVAHAVDVRIGGVHAVAQRPHLIGHDEVRGTEAHIGSFPATRLHDAGHEVRTSQQTVRLFNVPAGQQQADARGRNGRAVVALQVVRLHAGAAHGRPRVEIAHRTRRPRAELEVVAHVQERRNGAVKGLHEELLGRRGGEIAGERQHRDDVDAAVREHAHALLVRHELLQAVGVEHLVGIDVERERDRNTAVFSRSLLRLIDKEAMPLVHTVKHAESARCARQHAIVERGIYVKNLCHGLLLGKIHSRA